MKILTYPNETLNMVSRPVTEVNDSLREFIVVMKLTMIRNNGMGLSAPQLGLLERFFVYNDNGTIKSLINPEIVNGAEAKVVDIEGCLSVPGFTGDVPRTYKIQVKGLNERGNEVEFFSNGVIARVIQHEIDHLNGILFVEKISDKGRKVFIRKFLTRRRK